MPWMYINILANVDMQMKTSIRRFISLKLLKNAPKKYYHTYLILNDSLFKSKRSIYDTDSLIPIEPKIADFFTFKNAILYVGKGTLNRKQEHLLQAKKLFCGILPLQKVSLKLLHFGSKIKVFLYYNLTVMPQHMLHLHVKIV